MFSYKILIMKIAKHIKMVENIKKCKNYKLHFLKYYNYKVKNDYQAPINF